MRSLTILVALVISVSAESATPSKVVFQRLYDKLSQAFVQKNPKDFLEEFAPDFKQLTPGQPAIGRSQMVMALRSQMGLLSHIKWVREVKSVKAVKGGYDVLVTGHMAATMAGTDGRPHKIVVDGAALDHWTVGLKLQQAKVLGASRTVDGKIEG